MIASTDASKQNADSPKRKFDRQSGSRAAGLILLCCLTILFTHTQPCQAQDLPDAADNQTLSIRFISLKPENTIGVSQLQLYTNGTLDFSIEGEKPIITQGTWSLEKNRFSAAIHFTIDKPASFHYRLNFDGYQLLGLYAGLARLSEYDYRQRLTQEIGFLFYALPPGYKLSDTFPKMQNNE